MRIPTPPHVGMKIYTNAEIWDACVDVLQSRPGPLEVRDVAVNAGVSEEKIITALIYEAGVRRKAVTFRYPPLPCAAITSIS